MDHESYPDRYLRDILTSVRTIAVVGASPRRERPSHRVMAYLQRRGYRTIPVNPNAVGDAINGETVYARLADVPEPIDMVDVFRRPEFCPPHSREAVEVGARSLWLQLGIRSDESRRIAEAGGLAYVEDACTAALHARHLAHGS